MLIELRKSKLNARNGYFKAITLPEAGRVGSQAAEVLLSVVVEWKCASLSSFRSADITGSNHILLAADELLRVEELAVRSSPETGNVLACTLLI